MAPVAYTLIATPPDEATRRACVAWLETGHTAEGVRAGAVSGTIVVIEGRAHPVRVKTRRRFMTKESPGQCLQEQAPGPRAVGLRRFGPGTGLRSAREAGQLIE
ncbi:MAG: hypothetical protein IPJ41_09080 [Phycisphaerales bacterium]|nr:hypothetical protein [Phycisphaerales bacterium]